MPNIASTSSVSSQTQRGLFGGTIAHGDRSAVLGILISQIVDCILIRCRLINNSKAEDQAKIFENLWKGAVGTLLTKCGQISMCLDAVASIAEHLKQR